MVEVWWCPGFGFSREGVPTVLPQNFLRRLGVTFARFGLASAFATVMSDTNHLEALQLQLETEIRVTEALEAQYKKALQRLHAAMEREAQLQSTWARLEENSQTFE